MNTLGLERRGTEIDRNFIQKIDEKKTGAVDFDEFKNFIESGETNDQEDLREAFNLLDKEGTGNITVE